jgi:CRP-like cAMP-binding protein
LYDRLLAERESRVRDWLYIILSGDVEVWFEQNGERKKVAALRDGDFFGEFGMMTGKPRTSTVLAITDVVCFRLDNLAFQDVITARPKLAEEISHIMVARKMALDAISEELSEELLDKHRRDSEHGLLNDIKSFFKLNTDS